MTSRALIDLDIQVIVLGALLLALASFSLV